MILISWNLNGRRRDTTAQIEALLLRQPDVIALQEVTLSSLPLIREALAGGRLSHLVDSFTMGPPNFKPSGPRRYCLLIASRYPLVPELPSRFQVPWPERILGARLAIADQHVLLYNTHIPPGSSNGWTKIEVLRGLFTGLAVASADARILCGDFNTPQTELPDGGVVTWAQRPTNDGGWRVVGRLQNGLGSEWDSAERQVLTGLAQYDLVDVYRMLHGYGTAEQSWILRRGNREVGRRFDHVFASRGLAPQTCQYLHNLRESGLSDHSPIEVRFGLGSDPTGVTCNRDGGI
ncbi:MAG: endonuclease/exonuclease/phosphatase family protein [Gemmatimonadaceae bacterium]|nr:endonuclease/exonuclease/phosphatase family protein [Gemmatimonadaceae bacterium]